MTISYKMQPGNPIPSQISRRVRRGFGVGLALFLLIFFALVFFAPFLWLFSTALKSPADLSAFPIEWFPAHPQWGNFIQALHPANFDYGQGVINSLIIAGISASLTTLSSALVGFGFARLRGKGKHVVFMLMLSTIMIPSILTVIPTYVLFTRFGIIGTYWPWVLFGLGSSPFLSFLFRQFFTSIPQEIEDAAIVDGCNYLRIFLQIFLPLSQPVIATAIILTFTFSWGDYLTPLLFLNADNTTLAVDLSTGYTDPHGNPSISLLAAGSIFYILPMMVLFFFAQRYFIKGIVTTGMKG